MEIQAALDAVAALSGPLIVVSDSTFVVNRFRDGWWRGWRARLAHVGQETGRQPRPLGTAGHAVRERGDVTFRWVKGPRETR